MIKNTFFIFIVTNALSINAQVKVKDFGYRKDKVEFLGDTVHFIIKSKKGEEFKKKPILIFIQGSLAKPLIKFSSDGRFYSPFPFSENIFLD